jgi:hypothetical protein
MLVTGVGASDPWGRGAGPTDGPVLAVLAHLDRSGWRADRVVIAVTMTHNHTVELVDGSHEPYRQPGMEVQAGELDAEIRRRYAGLTPTRLELRLNPTNVDELIQQLNQELGRIPLAGSTVHVSLSSGTPAMAAALAFLVDSGRLPAAHVWQAFDPRPFVHAINGQLLPAQLVHEVKRAHLAESSGRERALALLRALAFGHAAEAFREVGARSVLPARRLRANAVSTLVSGYDHWDRAEFLAAQVDFVAANRAFRDAEMPVTREATDGQRAQAVRIAQEFETARGENAETTETLAMLLEIYASVLRRAAAGDALSVPTRGRRLYEAILNHVIYEAGLSPRRLGAGALEAFERQHPAAGAAVRACLPPGWPEHAAFAIRDLRTLAAVAVRVAQCGVVPGLDGDVVSRIEATYLGFERVRNRSFEEHGLEPVTPADVAAVVEAVTRMVRLLPSMAGVDPAEVPFGPASIAAVADAIATEL